MNKAKAISKRNSCRREFQRLSSNMFASENAIFERNKEDGVLTIYPNVGGEVTSEDLAYFTHYYNEDRGYTPTDLSRVPVLSWQDDIVKINREFSDFCEEDENQELELVKTYDLLPKETVYEDRREKTSVAVESLENLEKSLKTHQAMNEECVTEFQKILALLGLEQYDPEDIWDDINCLTEHIEKELDGTIIIPRDLFTHIWNIVSKYQKDNLDHDSAVALTQMQEIENELC